MTNNPNELAGLNKKRRILAMDPSFLIHSQFPTGEKHIIQDIISPKKRYIGYITKKRRNKKKTFRNATSSAHRAGFRVSTRLMSGY